MSSQEKNGAIITLSEANELIANFNTNYPNGVKANLIDADLVKQLLNQKDCVGIRIYNGYNNEEKRITPIFFGVDNNNQDITEIILDKTSPTLE